LEFSSKRVLNVKDQISKDYLTFGFWHLDFSLRCVITDMGVRKISFLLTFFVFLCFSSSPSMAEEDLTSLNFWPLFQYTHDPIEGVREIEGLGPFFHWRKEPDQRQWGIRPLFYWTGDETDSLRRLEFLYPFGKYQIKEGDKKGYLFPIANYRDQTFDEKRKWDFQFFPFFIGETEKGEDYYGIFPIFGTLLGRYGKEEIRFYLWPVYSESTSEGVHTTNILWPFLSFVEGESEKGYRFWPFYGRREKLGVSKAEFLLWPVFLRKTQGLDTDDPIEEKMIFPFYISKESKHFDGKTYLWPFFSHSENRLIGFEQWDLPWPFFRSIKGENLYGIRIFILYGYKVREDESKRVFILYPLYRYDEDQMRGIRERTYHIFFSRIQTSEDDQGIRKERSLRIWPLFDYEREETGHEAFSIFYLFPFRDDGFERNLFPLFRVFRWEKDSEGNASTNLFWGFYKRLKKRRMDSWEIAHLIGMKQGEGWKRISFLKGLVQYKSDGETGDLRFFYLPFHLRWSHHNPSKPPLKKAGEGGFLPHYDEGSLRSLQKELANEQQEDRDIGDRFICSGKGSFQF